MGSRIAATTRNVASLFWVATTCCAVGTNGRQHVSPRAEDAAGDAYRTPALPCTRTKVASPTSGRRAASVRRIRRASGAARTAGHRSSNADPAVAGARPTCRPWRRAPSTAALTRPRPARARSRSAAPRPRPAAAPGSAPRPARCGRPGPGVRPGSGPPRARPRRPAAAAKPRGRPARPGGRRGEGRGLDRVRAPRVQAPFPESAAEGERALHHDRPCGGRRGRWFDRHHNFAERAEVQGTDGGRVAAR
jgi:hypothetical protein